MTPHWIERRGELREWLTSQPRVLIGCDFDGTLAPIAPHPREVRLAEGTREILSQLKELPSVTVAVISGRSLADVTERVNLSGVLYAGNHGMEMMRPDGSQETVAGADAGRDELERVLAELNAAISPIPGAWVEDKYLTVSVHYRLVDDAEQEHIERLVRHAMSHAEGLTLRSGKKIWEIRPVMHWHKGSALTWYMQQCKVVSRSVAFMGDDLTDYDAFEVLSDGWSFFVGGAAPSTVRARLEDVPDTVKLLEWMVRVRREALHFARL